MNKPVAIVLLTVSILAGCLSIASAQAPAVPAAAPAVSAPPAAAPAGGSSLKMERQMTLWSLIKSGGWAMWPLGACSVAVVFLTALNFMRVNRKLMIPSAAVAQIRAAAQKGSYQQVLNIAMATDSFYTRSLAAGLSKIQPDDLSGSRPRVEAAIGETASREETQYAFFVNFLSLLTSMSPMWGLLGTVSGMIGAFSKIGEGGMGKPEMLAKNIGEALVCTATGLMIAITAMGFYFLFRNILNTVMKDAEHEFSEILDNVLGPSAGAGETT